VAHQVEVSAVSAVACPVVAARAADGNYNIIMENESILKIAKKKLIFSHVFFAMVIFLAGYYVSYLWELKQDDSKLTNRENERRLSGYTWINPLLECDIFNVEMTGNNILSHMKSDIENKIKESGVSGASVYFRDLNNGPWLGINENENFTPASLMKVPLMIAVLKNQEVDPNFLKKKVVYRKPEVLQQNIGEKVDFVDGKEYTIEQYLEYTITYSSNEAAEYLLENVNGEVLKKVFYDFGVPDPTQGPEENYMSVKDYASFFRILYNASYLEKVDSEKALQILSKSKYMNGLVAGLPDDVPVAHKFGERNYVANGKELKQLHDCGVIYAASRKYILCVMTRSDSFDQSKALIKDISKIVYDRFVLENK
jgi:beta-lactamase class A